MNVISGKLVGSGIDWLTVTQSFDMDEEPPKARLHAITQNPGIIDDNKVASFGGYQGKSYCGGTMRYGSRTRENWFDTIIVCSGPMAGRIFSVIVTMGFDFENDIRFTRLDEQFTVKLDNCDPGFISGHYNYLQAKKYVGEGLTGRRKPVLYRSEKGDTVYIGKRSSRGNFYRIYDKSNDYSSQVGDYVRFEVERGRETALGAAKILRKGPLPIDRVFDLAKEFTVNCGVVYTSEYKDFSVSYGELEEVSRQSVEDMRKKRLEWLRRNVSPMVTKMIGSGDIDSVIDALKLDRYLTKGDLALKITCDFDE